MSRPENNNYRFFMTELQAFKESLNFKDSYKAIDLLESYLMYEGHKEIGFLMALKYFLIMVDKKRMNEHTKKVEKFDDYLINLHIDHLEAWEYLKRFARAQVSYINKTELTF